MLPPPYIQAKSCDEVLKTVSSNFFKAFVVLPVEERQALKKIYVLFHILDDCVDEMPDALSQRQALNVWRFEIQQMYLGQPQHSITKELWPIVKHYQIPKDYFLGLAEGCEKDIDQHAFQTFEELEKYCYQVAGLVGLSCHKIFKYKTKTSDQSAIHLGLAFQLTNILRDLAEDAKRGRVYLPLEWMSEFDYSVNDLQNSVYNQKFIDLMTKVSQVIEEQYKLGMQEFANDRHNQLVAVKIMFKTYHMIFENIKKANYQVFQHKITLSTLQKFKIAVYSFLIKYHLT